MIHDTCGKAAQYAGVVEVNPELTNTIIVRHWCPTCQIGFDVPYLPGYRGEKQMIQLDKNQKNIIQLLKEKVIK